VLDSSVFFRKNSGIACGKASLLSDFKRIRQKIDTIFSGYLADISPYIHI